MPDLFGLSFARPLWLLGLLPAAVLLVSLYRRGWRRSGWEQLLPAHLHPWLLQQHAGGHHRLRFAALGLTWALALLALAGPQLETTSEPRRLQDSSLVIVLDVSRNMLSNDLSPSRLQRARYKIRDVLQEHADSEVALVAFAGSAHRVAPLSSDHDTLASLLAALEPNIMPAEGQDIGQALLLARQMLEQRPRSSSQILLVTSGLDSAGRAALAEHAQALGSQLAILGVGTSSGAPVPLAEGGFMRDEQGRILLPRLNGQQLAAVARQHGARYHGISTSDRDIDYLLQHGRATASAEPGAQRLLVDQGHWLVLLLLPIAALGARRGWLGLLLCAALLPAPPAQAFSWQDLWLRPDQQAMQLLDQQQPAAAAERFLDPAWHAWALYQAGQYPQAAAAWAELAEREPDNPQHHFNQGTAEAMAGEYQAALEAYEQTLTRAPEHHAARHNRDAIEALLEQLRQQAEQSPAQGTEATEDSAAEPSSETDAGADATGAASTSAAQEQTQESTEDAGPPTASGSATPGPSGDSGNGSPATPSGNGNDGAGASDRQQAASLEQQQALEQWLQDIPDDPAELLRRKFLHQYLQRQETSP